MDLMLRAEVMALRALLMTWMDGALAHNPDRREQCELIDEMAQVRAREFGKFVNATPEEETIIRETAALRISQMMSEIGTAP